MSAVANGSCSPGRFPRFIFRRTCNTCQRIISRHTCFSRSDGTKAQSYTAFNSCIGIMAEDSNVFLIRCQRGFCSGWTDDDSTLNGCSVCACYYTVIAKNLRIRGAGHGVLGTHNSDIRGLLHFIAVTDNSCCTATIGFYGFTNFFW